MTATIISSVGTKGGTGKTSLVKHFGIAKSEEGYRVLLIDLCQNSDIATRLGYNREDFKYDTYDWVSEAVPFEAAVQHDDETNLDFIPASNLVEKILDYAQKKRAINQEWILKEKLKEVEDRYDYILFDNHPTETNRMMIMSLVASHMALIPTLLDISSVVATIRTVEIVKALQEQGVPIEYHVVPMAVDFSKGFKKELEGMKEEFRKMEIVNVTKPIRYSAVVTRAGLNNQVLNGDNPYMRNVLDDYRDLAKEFEGRRELI